MASGRNSRHSGRLRVTFDFRLHADRSRCVGTQYFEFVPGRYCGKHWLPGGRFIDENSFCLFEGIFEEHLPRFDHFGFGEVSRAQWKPILADILELRGQLLWANGKAVQMPFGRTLRVEDDFQQDIATNRAGLAVSLSELEGWLRQTLTVYDCVSVLGL